MFLNFIRPQGNISIVFDTIQQDFRSRTSSNWVSKKDILTFEKNCIINRPFCKHLQSLCSSWFINKSSLTEPSQTEFWKICLYTTSTDLMAFSTVLDINLKWEKSPHFVKLRIFQIGGNRLIIRLSVNEAWKMLFKFALIITDADGYRVHYFQRN